jgi:transcriptional regulator with GAF, ATPase, and Fis domain
MADLQQHHPGSSQDAASDGRPWTLPHLAPIAALLERGVDLEALLGAMVDTAMRVLGAERGTLYLVDRQRQELFSKAAHLPELREIRLALGQGVAGRAATSGEVLHVADAYADPRFDRSVDERTGFRTRALLAAPIRDHEGLVIGVLQLVNKLAAAGPGFSEGDVELARALAEEAGEVLEKTSLHAELAAPASTPPRPIDYRYNFIVGTSTAMRQVYELIDKAASTSATVILQGESGTGKGLIARAIHLNSERRDQPFITVDCTTLPPSLIESELFGHERGAFTGATRARPGKFELAAGGTVFIDEIGDLPPELQGKLLRVLQDREFERVGGSTTLRVDIRLVAATHRNLDEMVAEGSFRADLYYRIRVLPIMLPPLRERGADDIQRLATHFLEAFAKKHRRACRSFTPAAMRRLLGHRWPGNIRELENCVESAVVLSDGRVVDEAHLALPASRPVAKGRTDLSRSLAEAERDYVLAVLADVGGNQSEAARRLAIGRNTLLRKLREYQSGLDT